MSDTRDIARGAAALLRQYGELAGRWSPLPHQVPPPPGFYGWMLMAGRGSGKTDTCANYMVRHVKGPPCLKGPHPHWMGIIAPTLGDAATSCFSGPSGISAHDPSAEMVTTKGGTIIRWPDGSEAKLFGAHTEEDVNRLRSGGNRCAAEGTLIRTECGQVPIEQVRVGDRVWTRNGLRRVLAVWDNGIKEVHRYDHAAGSTWLTPDHKVWTDRGWQPVSLVSTSDTVFTWQTSSNTTVFAGIPTTMIPTTATADGDSCTGGCGSLRSGRSLPACRCITRITTSGTIGSPTSFFSLPESTGRSTVKSAVPTGTVSEVMRPGSARNTGRSSVSVAGSPSNHGRRPGPDIALLGAGRPVHRHAHSNSGCAVCAADPSSARPVMRRAPVRGGVLRSSRISRVARVYDLTVEHDHEFFADDLVSANCLQWLEEMAAWRWLDQCWHHMRFGLRSGPNPHWVASTTPRPRPLIKDIDRGKFDRVVVRHASMYDNPHLPGDIRRALEEAYAGTTLGAQELEGRIVDQDENALWQREHIERNRVIFDVIRPTLIRRTVGVDPSGGAGEQGIVVTAKTKKLRLPGFEQEVSAGYVLADATVHLAAAKWGKRVIETAVEWDADDVCVEKNFGGDMAIETVRAAAEKMGIAIPIRFVNASRGKLVRAAPVGALTEQGRFRFAGTFEALEDQLCTWSPEAGYSPDRLDAMVWGPHHMKLVHMAPAGTGTIGMEAARRPIAGPGGGRPMPEEAAREMRRSHPAGAPGRRIG